MISYTQVSTSKEKKNRSTLSIFKKLTIGSISKFYDLIIKHREKIYMVLDVIMKNIDIYECKCTNF